MKKTALKRDMIELFMGWGETRFLGGTITGKGNPKYSREENSSQWNLCVIKPTQITLELNRDLCGDK